MSKWTIAKEDLEGAMAIISSVPPRNGIKASEFIKIEREGSDTTSFSLASDVISKALVRTGKKFPLSHAIYLDRRMFLPFVDMGKELSSPVYTFIFRNDGGILVKHGMRKVKYEKVKEITGYEDVPSIAKAKMSSLKSARWLDLVDAAKQCATDDPVAPQFNCVYLYPTENNLHIYAGNGRIVFRGLAPKIKTIQEPIAFPLLLIDSLILENAKELFWTHKFAMVIFPRGKIWQAVKIAARKSFPLSDAKALMRDATSDKIVMEVPASVMSRVANRMASYVAALSRESLVLTVDICKDSTIAQIKSGSGAVVFKETITLAKPAKQTFTLEWPLEHVMPILLYCKEDGLMKIHINKKGRSCITTDTVSLVIARRVTSKKKTALKK